MVIARKAWVRWFALTAALLTIAVTVAVVIWPTSSSVGGPLVLSGGLPSEGTIGHGWSVNVGDRFMWGFTIARNTGSTPIDLVSVQMLPQTEPSPVVDARAYSLTAHPGVLSLALWPISRNKGYQDWQAVAFPELAGYAVPGGHDVGIAVIIEKRQPGEMDWNAIRVTYEADGKKYIAEGASVLSICTPSGVDCPNTTPSTRADG